MRRKIIFFLIFVFLIFFIKREVWSIEGCFCNQNSLCYPDGCTRKPINENNQVDKELCRTRGCHGPYECCYNTDSVEANRYFCLEQPPCCDEMIKRNDAEACCWPERGYCHPEYCKKLSDPKGCGHYWIWNNDAAAIGWYLRPYGYGCIKGTSPQTAEPVFGLPKIAGGGVLPTSTPIPIPTKKPTAIPVPTNKPTSTTFPMPTERDQPIKIILSPTRFNWPTNTPITPPPISFPTSFFPSPTKFIPMVTPFNLTLKENLFNAVQNIKKEIEQVQIKTKVATKKIAEPQKKIFLKAKEMDQKLENYLNERIIFLTLRIFKFKLSF